MLVNQFYQPTAAFVAAVVAGNTSFDSGNKSIFITLSGSDLIASATVGAGNGTNVRSLASHSSGTYKAEFTLTTAGGGAGFGICNGSFPIGSVGTWAGSTNDCMVMYTDGHWYLNSTDVDSGVGTFGAGDVMTLEVDLTNKLIYGAKNSASLSAGASFAALGSGPFYFIVEGEGNGVVWTANTGGSAYTRAATGGYINW